MKTIELETSRKTEKPFVDVNRINELEIWFKTEYLERLATINRYKYLGLPCTDSLYSIEYEAYQKENELRVLKGLDKLPSIKNTKLL